MNRYIVRTERYVLAQNDEEVIKEAQLNIRFENLIQDNGARVISIAHAPFRQSLTRELDLKEVIV